jgi:hypothetical protein
MSLLGFSGYARGSSTGVMAKIRGGDVSSTPFGIDGERNAGGGILFGDGCLYVDIIE